MVLYRRNRVPGGTYFFTVTLADRRSFSLVDHVDLLRAACRHTREQMPFSIDAIVISPGHIHAIRTLPPDDSNFARRWHRIKAQFTHEIVSAGANIARDRRGEYRLWQGRFWEHTIGDDNDFERCTNFIHFNPVKHGLVTLPAAWPLSSIHRYIRLGMLPPDWGGDKRDEHGDYGQHVG